MKTTEIKFVAAKINDVPYNTSFRMARRWWYKVGDYITQKQVLIKRSDCAVTAKVPYDIYVALKEQDFPVDKLHLTTRLN